MDPDSKFSPAPAQRGGAGLTAEIIIGDPRWRRAVPNLRHVVERAVRSAGGACTVMLDSDQRIRRLNAEFRGIDKPTNVLTFSSGDIALAYGVAKREAAAEGKSLADHMLHLVVHGVLHLNGFDHVNPGHARQMEMEETRIMRQMRRPDPWGNR